MLRETRELLNRKWGECLAFLKDTPDSFEREFIRHNRRIWRDYRRDKSPRREILIEANNIAGCNIAMSYVASYLGRVQGASVVVFAKALSRAKKRLYESFVDAFLLYSAEACREEVDSLLATILPTIRSKRDLEDLRVDGIWIGDLIYDTYIRRFDRVTVDLSDRRLVDLVRESLELLVFWRRYFADHQVSTVLVSHAIFIWAGILTRIAVSRSVPVYLTQINKLYYLTESHNSRAYNDYVDFPQRFAELSSEERCTAIRQAKDRIARRFRGERDVGAFHLIAPTYMPKLGKRVLEASPRVKVLVATHCFSDDNHIYGNNLFPDFYEWLSFLGGISERTDYDWYVKLHPDRYPWETRHIEDLARQFPKFRILQSDVSHHQIVEDGITCLLTVYGTIGFEYAALGVPVITASPWNPTVAYDFNIHPKTVEEYERILMDLGSVKVRIDVNKVYEYYYCQYMNAADNWLCSDLDSTYAEVCARQGPGGTLFYRRFIEEYSERKHERILATVDTFVRSGAYCLRPQHFPAG